MFISSDFFLHFSVGIHSSLSIPPCPFLPAYLPVPHFPIAFDLIGIPVTQYYTDHPNMAKQYKIMNSLNMQLLSTWGPTVQNIRRELH